MSAIFTFTTIRFIKLSINNEQKIKQKLEYESID